MHVGCPSQLYTEGSLDSEESLFFLCAYVFICTMTVQVPAETRGLEGIRSTRTGVIGSCEPQGMDSLQEQ